MRRSKEIIVLLALLVGAMGFVLWYVIDRRAKNRAAPAPALATQPPGPTPAGPPVGTKSAASVLPVATTTKVLPANEPVALGTATTERKTVDFSSGKPVVKDSAEDKAAIDAAMKDIAEASQSVTFDSPPKQPAQPAPTK
ncbi:MAG TPA: hypothetical protein VIM71_06880 [Lacunisphaera sp.]